FTDSGEVVVSVSSLQSPKGYPVGSQPATDGHLQSAICNLQFSVRDTGIGIPNSRLDRLFKSFSQIDTAARRANSGSGLGLVISKRLSELMGGAMWVESEEGHGSTFYFTIVAEVESG